MKQSSKRNIRKIIHDHHQKVDNVEEVTPSLPIRTSLGMLEGLELAEIWSSSESTTTIKSIFPSLSTLLYLYIINNWI
ncbi:unnamed protein product [Rhizophagus irregularis]|nr:unnamed protein product [Rhizophagus irregularis]